MTRNSLTQNRGISISLLAVLYCLSPIPLIVCSPLIFKRSLFLVPYPFYCAQPLTLTNHPHVPVRTNLMYVYIPFPGSPIIFIYYYRYDYVHNNIEIINKFVVNLKYITS